MKNLIYIPIIILLGMTSRVMAQYNGRHFVSGSGSIGFNTQNYKAIEGAKSRGAIGFDMSVGKFVTEQKVTGWSLRGGLTLQKTTKDVTDSSIWSDKADGIEGYYAGIGKFWQYYKHVNEHWGFYGGPDIAASVNVDNEYHIQGTTEYVHTRTTAFALGFSLKAGAYYKLSEKCWLNASFAFINPVYLSFERGSNTEYNGSTHNVLRKSKMDKFNYALSPNLNLPAIGLGLTYFIR